MSHSAVAVPVGLAPDGSLIRPEEALAAERYRCPGCGAEVLLRRGELRRAHFAHRGSEGCATESVLHRAAKHRLLEVIEAWKAGRGPRPCISRPCRRHGCPGGVVQDVPDDITHAAAEVRLEGGTVADLVLYRGEAPAAVIEIVATHAVGHEKAGRFTLPWIELRADDVLERPYWWVAVQDGLQSFTCPLCAAEGEARAHRRLEIEGRALHLADQLGSSLPPSPPYQYVPHTCWRCGADMVVFIWPGGGGHSPRRPPEPIPPSVQHRVTEGAGDYWANCCPRCTTVQGDYYLRRENRDYAAACEVADR